MVKPGEPIHIFLNGIARSVKNMGSVLMYVDAAHLFGINITANMIPFVNAITVLPGLFYLMGKTAPKSPVPTIR